MKRSSKVIIDKIITYCDEILSFTQGFDNQMFVKDLKTLRAVTMCLIQIGELVYILDKQVKEAHPHIDWNGIAGLRHRLVHDYDGINYALIWDIVSNELEKLKREIGRLSYAYH
jgi:uncharacterized protein with HEPN domain